MTGYSSAYSASTYTTTASLLAGETYRFRVRAQNAQGWGPYSTTLSVLAASAPSQMAMLSVTDNAGVPSVRITWVAPNENGSPISAYEILILSSTPGAYYESLSECDGSDPVVATNLYCDVSMSTLASSPFDLSRGDAIVAKARARNIVGWSALYSEPNSGVAVTAQQAPGTPPTTVTLVSQSESSITVSMPPLFDLGGSPITSYNLQYDQGAAAGASSSTPAEEDFVSLIGEIPANNLAVTEVTLAGLNTNRIYSFRYRAANKHGWSGYSPVLGVVTATVPAAVAALSFSVESATPTSVTISWSAPYNGGNPITSYQVLIQHQDGVTLSEELSYCDGSQLAIITARRCEIPLTTLRAAPFSLGLDQLVTAQVAATNDVGQGAFSPLNTAGVRIQTEPLAPSSSPTLVSSDESTATVEITLLSGLEAGNAPVLYYELSWDQGLSQSAWAIYTVVPSATTQVSIDSLTSGATYAFRYRAQNIHGWSSGYSPVLEAVAMKVPGQVAPATTAMDGADVVLSWAVPFTGGQGIPLTAFVVQLQDSTGALTEYPSICDGSDPLVLATRSCRIPMARFSEPTSYDVNGLIDEYGMGLAQGELIVAVVSAVNAKGAGPPSEANVVGELAQRPPAAPLSAPSRGSGSSDGQLDIEWAFLTSSSETGGSPILSYALEVDDGAGGNFNEIVGGSPSTDPYTLNSKVVTTAIVSGAAYRARYRAYNVHGWGEYSPIGTITAASTPAAASEPTLSIVGTGVQISWSQPSDTGGDGIPLTSYRVELLLPDGTFAQDLVNCDGTDPAIVAARACTIPMATLTSTDPSSGFAYTQGAEVAARVTATNAIGEGEVGALSTTTTILAQVVPLKPLTPPRRGSSTGEAQIEIEWDGVLGLDTGGSAITSYNLQWDQGSGVFGVDLAGASVDYILTSYTLTNGLVAGGLYAFRYRAANKYGWGPWSDVATLAAADHPEQPSEVVTSIVDTFVKFSWTAPDDKSSAITAYEV